MKNFIVTLMNSSKMWYLSTPVLELLECYWCIVRGAVSMNIVELYGKSYVKMTAEELDDFCQWIYDMRESDFLCKKLNSLFCMHSLYFKVILEEKSHKEFKTTGILH